MLNPNLYYGNFTQFEYERYARHLVLPYIGLEGQKRLSEAKVLCVGVGGLGSACLLYLAAAGVNNIGVVDNDRVDISNLQRQVIYKDVDIGYSKVECIQQNLQAVNPNCNIQSYNKILDINNTQCIIPEYDIIIDGTDTLTSKQIISDACYIFNKPHIYGAVSEFTGQISVFNYQGGPQYRDLHLQNTFDDMSGYCSRNGILGVLPGIIGVLQATEVLKIIVGINNILSGSVLIYNAFNTSFKIIRLRKTSSSTQTYSQSEPLLHKSYIRSYKNLDFIGRQTSYIESPSKNSNPILLIDIRRKCEYKFNHIQGSINIPLRKLKHRSVLSFLADQSRSSDIYVYCNVAARSNAALSLLLRYRITAYKFNHDIASNTTLHLMNGERGIRTLVKKTLKQHFQC